MSSVIIALVIGVFAGALVVENLLEATGMDRHRDFEVQGGRHVDARWFKRAFRGRGQAAARGKPRSCGRTQPVRAILTLLTTAAEGGNRVHDRPVIQGGTTWPQVRQSASFR